MSLAPAPVPLRALTFNVHHGVGADGRLDLERVAALIEAVAPDVAALQEVDRHMGPRSGDVDQAGWLAERLGMRLAFGTTLDLAPRRAGAPRRRYGNALLSRHPLRSWRSTLLPRPQGGEPRCLLAAVVAVGGRRVRVLATHLQHDSPVERSAQVAWIRGAVRRSREPVVLLGDVNATPEAPEVAALSADLTDAWVAAGDGPGPTFPSRRPRLRIDYVFASPGVAVEMAALVPSDASDHLPLVVDLRA